MNKTIESYLSNYKKKKISLNEIERLFSGEMTYEEFAKEVLEFVELGILAPVKSHKTNNKIISLHNTYHIRASKLKSTIKDEIRNFQLICDSNIKLNNYYGLSKEKWEKDISTIKKIDKYLKINGLPKSSATAQERSYNIIGDEKWIDTSGKTLLERIQIWDKLKIDTNPDPLMFGINPNQFKNKKHKHLIVENKTTFYNLMKILKDTSFTSLIYGAGWRILANINSLEKQLGLEEDNHELYYFGDLDKEGISIWNGLNNIRHIKLAKEFYEEILYKDYTKGKINQRQNKEALDCFLENFNKEQNKQIKNLLEEGGYYPQEALDKYELKDLWVKLDGKINT